MSEPTLLLTRPLDQSRSFLSDLAGELGRMPTHVISPLLSIEQLPLTRETSTAQALLFTSINGIAALAARTQDRSPPALCVGPSTYTEAAAQGVSAYNANGTARNLLELATSRLSKNAGPVFHVSGRETAHDLAKSLSERGFQAQRLIPYHQNPLPLSDAALTAMDQGPTLLPVFSPKPAEILSKELPIPLTNPAHCICISQAAAAPLRELPLTITVADAPNRSAMIAATTKVLSG